MLQFFGNTSIRQGSYILVICLSKPQHIAFGRFQKGKPVLMQAGAYLYTGSAMGNRKGTDPLARRLLRHATRSGKKPPHRIRKSMIGLFKQEHPERQVLSPPREKKLKWHIDFLLDNRYSRITHIFVIHSCRRLESRISQHIASLNSISIPAKRLGASDMRHETHLVFMNSPDECMAAIEKHLLWLAEQDNPDQALPIRAPTNFERSKI